MSQLIPPVHCRALCPRGEEEGRGTEFRSAGVYLKNTHKPSVLSVLVGLPSDSNQSMPP